MAVVSTSPVGNMALTPWMQAQANWGNQVRAPCLGLLSVREAETAGSIR